MSDVSVVMVSHDGASWLPAVLDSIRAQSSAIAGVIAVDTGSKDGSADLIEAAFAGDPSIPAAVLRESGRTSYPQAVALALAALADHGIATEWVWLLHDDSNPAPDALEQLLGANVIRPDADFIGPKLREWPSLKRLVEIGVTISGTGRRETGLERGEYDQGQHDNIREVLAVNSAGLLARREALEALGGYDEHLPMFGNDIDLGWRAAAAGYTTIVVPQAVVFHAEAAHRGIRRTPLTGRHTHYQERRAALFTMLANCRRRCCRSRRRGSRSARPADGRVPRRPIGGGGARRAGGLVSVYSRPGSAARRPQGTTTAPGRATRPRPGPPAAAALVAALPARPRLRQRPRGCRDQPGRRRRRATPGRGRRARSVAAGRPAQDRRRRGLRGHRAGRPVPHQPRAVALAATAIAFVIGARDAFGAVSGGALSPVPAGAGDWWALHYESWHPIGFGSAVPAPPYVLPLALIASVLGTATTMTLLLVAAAPLALWGGWRYLRVVGRLVSRYGAPRWLLLWGSVSYALVPLVAGAWGGGRWGVVVAAAVLPWLAHAALGFAEPEGARRWRAAWRTGLLLALLAAAAPVMWWLCAILAAVVVAAAAVVVRGAIRERSVWGPPAIALAVPAVLLAPWWLPTVWEGAGGALFLDIGRWPTPATDGLELLIGRFAEVGAPWWVGLVLPVLAVLALIPRATRIGVVLCWLVAAVAAVLAVPLGLTTIDLTGAASQQAGLGAVLLVLHGAWVTAVLLGGLALTERSPSPVVLPRVAQAGTAIVGVAAVRCRSPGSSGSPDGVPTTWSRRRRAAIPVYMSQEAERAEELGILVIRGSVEDGLTYECSGATDLPSARTRSQP